MMFTNLIKITINIDKQIWLFILYTTLWFKIYTTSRFFCFKSFTSATFSFNSMQFYCFENLKWPIELSFAFFDDFRLKFLCYNFSNFQWWLLVNTKKFCQLNVVHKYTFKLNTRSNMNSIHLKNFIPSKQYNSKF